MIGKPLATNRILEEPHQDMRSTIAKAENTKFRSDGCIEKLYLPRAAKNQEENAGSVNERHAAACNFHGIIGHSQKMREVFELLERVIPCEARILIEGESGTGKELIAHTIHDRGPRRHKKFIAVDCGALPENLLESEFFGHIKGAFTGAISDKKGLFEAAHQGTLFLDEIANTTQVFQAKLLRAIQEGEIKPVGAFEPRKVDVRIIAATSGSLRQKVLAGEFREDLYYRLNVITVNLPPLRERTNDIRPLAEYFLKKFSEKTGKPCRGFASPALQMLASYKWPGNIRELENAIERAVNLALPENEWISPEFLPVHIVQYEPEALEAIIQSHGNLTQALDYVERRMILEALAKYAGNRTGAAKSLGITRQTLIHKIKLHKL